MTEEGQEEANPASRHLAACAPLPVSPSNEGQCHEANYRSPPEKGELRLIGRWSRRFFVPLRRLQCGWTASVRVKEIIYTQSTTLRVARACLVLDFQYALAAGSLRLARFGWLTSAGSLQLARFGWLASTGITDIVQL